MSLKCLGFQENMQAQLNSSMKADLKIKAEKTECMFIYNQSNAE